MPQYAPPNVGNEDYTAEWEELAARAQMAFKKGLIGEAQYRALMVQLGDRPSPTSLDQFGYSQDEMPMTAGERLAAGEHRLHEQGKHGDEVLPGGEAAARALMWQATKDYFNPRVRRDMDQEGAALGRGRPFDGKPPVNWNPGN
jgi:hypothetical protein